MPDGKNLPPWMQGKKKKSDEKSKAVQAAAKKKLMQMQGKKGK